MTSSFWEHLSDALRGSLRAESSRETESALEAAATSERDPVAAMPFALAALAHPQPRIRDAAIESVCSLAAAIPPSRLPELERFVREPTWRSASWLGMTPETLRLATWPTPVWALFTMHGNG
ncbi:MAG: hypothetical protein HZA52_10165 [Planctomycetes bacterium]|nr:hypothetical protein [Planctomycetota bacterium]